MMQESQSEMKRFYGLDGDKIGSVIESYMIKEEITSLTEFSRKVDAALEEIKRTVLENNGVIIFCAGDSILFQGQFSNIWCDKILNRFLSLTGRTASMGIGKTATEAYLALKLAKATGGGKVAYFSLSQTQL